MLSCGCAGREGVGSSGGDGYQRSGRDPGLSLKEGCLRKRNGVSTSFTLEREALRNVACEEGIRNLTVTFFDAYGKHESVY